MKFFLAVIVFLFFLLSPQPALAAKEFSNSYDATYEILESGQTQVTEEITLKNLTPQIYATSFSLLIGASDITDLSAYDKRNQLEVSSQSEGNNQKITVNFDQQIAGQNKEYTWFLAFKSRDFLETQGKTRQVSIPRVVESEDLDNLQLTLVVPTSFGDPTFINPEPVKTAERAGKVYYTFAKNDLVQKGVRATFGSEQLFSLNLVYELENNGVFPKVIPIALPFDYFFQETILNYLSPKPENITFDSDGNMLAWFKVERGSRQTVVAQGLIKNSSTANIQDRKLSAQEVDKLTAATKYWDKDNVIVKGKLLDIGIKDEDSPHQKAQKIYQFVSTNLQFNEKRLQQKNFERLGAITALNNPDNALSSEFVDLFVTLCRSSGVPAKAVIGIAGFTNKNLRPLSFQNDQLHMWAQYFDPNLGWVMVDPAWEQTTGGVDYFSKLDLNHITLYVQTQDQEISYPAKVTVEDYEGPFEKKVQLESQLFTPDEIFGFAPNKGRIIVRNSGNSISPGVKISLKAPDLVFSPLFELKQEGSFEFTTVDIPPNGELEFAFDIRSSSPFYVANQDIELLVGEQKITKKILVKSFLSRRYFLTVLASLAGFIFLVYIVTINIFHRFVKNKTLSLPNLVSTPASLPKKKKTRQRIQNRVKSAR